MILFNSDKRKKMDYILYVGLVLIIVKLNYVQIYQLLQRISLILLGVGAKRMTTLVILLLICTMHKKVYCSHTGKKMTYMGTYNPDRKNKLYEDRYYNLSVDRIIS